MKKRNVIILLIVLVLGIAIYAIWPVRNAYTIAKLTSNLNISEKTVIEKFQETWAPNGDGECLVILKLDSDQLKQIQIEAKNIGYKNLPIENPDVPDNTIYSYISKEDSIGLYKLDIEKEDKRNYSITVIDGKSSKLIVYYVIF